MKVKWTENIEYSIKLLGMGYLLMTPLATSALVLSRDHSILNMILFPLITLCSYYVIYKFVKEKWEEEAL
jgi:hypothetical protein